MIDGSFDFYGDANLTTRLTDILSQHNGAAFPTSNDFQLWFGSPDPAFTLVSASGNITVTVTDTLPGSPPPTTAVKLALTSGALGAGTQTLSLGVTTQTGGVSNAITLWVRVTDSVGTEGFTNQLGLTTNSVYALG